MGAANRRENPALAIKEAIKKLLRTGLIRTKRRLSKQWRRRLNTVIQGGCLVCTPSVFVRLTDYGGTMGRKVCALSISFIACLIFVCSTHAGDSSNLHRDKTHAFSIVFPTGWQQRNGQTPSTVVVSESPYEDSIVIQVRQIPAQATLENLPAAELKAMFTDMAEALRVRFPDIVVKDSGHIHQQY